MKFLILFFISFNLYASNFIPVSSVANNSQAGYSLLVDCQKASALDEVCQDVGENPISTYETYTYQIDDESKPIYSKSNIITCTDKSDCDIKFISYTCTSPEWSIKNYELLQIYCTKISGYELKTMKGIRQSDALIATYNSQKSIKDASDLQEKKLQEKIHLIDAGKRVIALFNLRNEAKGLTGAQIGQMLSDFSAIKGLLETGSLNTAKYLIGQVVADGTLITEADKVALINEINKFIP